MRCLISATPAVPLPITVAGMKVPKHLMGSRLEFLSFLGTETATADVFLPEQRDK